MGTIAEEATNFLTFVGAERPRPDSVFILVMGLTGSGKSSLIADITERKDVQIGHELESCTSSMAIFQVNFDGRDVYLIDTPGFDDANRENMDILMAITHYFSVSYANRVFINGIIYLHRISDTRLGGAAKTNLEMLKGLCGRSAFSNIAVATTMWSPHGQERLSQENREQQLKDTYLADMIKEGTRVIRHDCSRSALERQASAKAIFRQVFDTWKDDHVVLQIQYDMVEHQSRLENTAAGMVLEAQMLEEQEMLEKRLKHIAENRMPTSPRTSNVYQLGNESLRDQEAKIRQRLDVSRKTQESMRLSLLELHQNQEERFMAQLQAMKNKWKEELKSREEDYRLLEQKYRRRQLLEREEGLREREASITASQNYGLRVPTWLQEEIRTQQLPTTHTPERHEDLAGRLEHAEIELPVLKSEIEAKLKTTERVKEQWAGPLLQGLVAGGLGIVGSAITAVEECYVSSNNPDEIGGRTIRKY
ncbi:P-loop containing nucleoside triphosphate hydrolase protein [Hypoxylon sp. FL1857]|nr:P-loop containing nucleoside triphosphate hydrolase protein [Hypoxylon sp. FL1857]